MKDKGHGYMGFLVRREPVQDIQQDEAEEKPKPDKGKDLRIPTTPEELLRAVLRNPPRRKRDKP